MSIMYEVIEKIIAIGVATSPFDIFSYRVRDSFKTFVQSLMTKFHNNQDV